MAVSRGLQPEMEEPRMSTSLMIRARVIGCVREGAFAVARDVAEAIDHAADREEMLASRDRLAGVCALLERVGWSAGEPAVETELDGGAHAATLAAVVGVMLPLMKRWLGELSSDDPAKPVRDEEYRLLLDLQASVRPLVERFGTIAIPADVVVQLREALFGQLGDVAQGLEAVIVRPAAARRREWVEPVALFDRARAVLDLIGWDTNRRPRSTSATIFASGTRMASTAGCGRSSGWCPMPAAGRSKSWAHGWIAPSAKAWKSCCGKRRRWRPSASLPGVWRTTSTTSWR